MVFVGILTTFYGDFVSVLPLLFLKYSFCCFFYSLQYSSYSTVATVHALSIFFRFFRAKRTEIRNGSQLQDFFILLIWLISIL